MMSILWGFWSRVRGWSLRDWWEDAWPRLRRLIIQGGTLCQIVLYPCIFIGGLYMLVTSVPNVVEEEMGPHVRYLWAWVLVVCPAFTFIAYRLSMTRWADLSPILSITGNTGLTMALAAYVAAVVQSAWLGKGLFAFWVFIGFTVLVGLIAVRDVLRFRDARLLERVTR